MSSCFLTQNSVLLRAVACLHARTVGAQRCLTPSRSWPMIRKRRTMRRRRRRRPRRRGPKTRPRQRRRPRRPRRRMRRRRARAKKQRRATRCRSSPTTALRATTTETIRRPTSRRRTRRPTTTTASRSRVVSLVDGGLVLGARAACRGTGEVGSRVSDRALAGPVSLSVALPHRFSSPFALTGP